MALRIPITNGRRIELVGNSKRKRPQRHATGDDEYDMLTQLRVRYLLQDPAYHRHPQSYQTRLQSLA